MPPPPEFCAVIAIAHPPLATAENTVISFLTYHHQFVRPNHYFWPYDSNQFSNIGFYDLVTTFVPMQYAVAAYAALLYSVFRRDRRAREYAFLYYAQTIYYVQKILNAGGEIPAFPVLVTILELSCFEVGTYFSPV